MQILLTTHSSCSFPIGGVSGNLGSSCCADRLGENIRHVHAVIKALSKQLSATYQVERAALSDLVGELSNICENRLGTQKELIVEFTIFSVHGYLWLAPVASLR